MIFFSFVYKWEVQARTSPSTPYQENDDYVKEKAKDGQEWAYLVLHLKIPFSMIWKKIKLQVALLFNSLKFQLLQKSSEEFIVGLWKIFFILPVSQRMGWCG